jgi:hypothetical protein
MRNETETRLVEKLHCALHFLAVRCDGARSLDGQGFNKHDSGYGHCLVEVNPDRWTDKDIDAAKRMVRKYQGQLEQGGFSLGYLGITPTKPKAKEFANVINFKNSGGDSLKIVGALGRSNLVGEIVAVLSRHGFSVEHNDFARVEAEKESEKNGNGKGKGFVDYDSSILLGHGVSETGFIFSIKLHQRDMKAIADIKATFLKRRFSFEKCIWTVSASIPQIIDFVDRQFLVFTDRAAEFVARIQEQKKQEKPAAYGSEWKANGALSLFD